MHRLTRVVWLLFALGLLAGCAPRTALPPASPLECAKGGDYACPEAREKAHELRPVSENPPVP